MNKLSKLLVAIIMVFLPFFNWAQTAQDSIEIPLEKETMQNEAYREQMYPLIGMCVLILMLLFVFLYMRSTGKNKRNNYRKSFKN